MSLHSHWHSQSSAMIAWTQFSICQHRSHFPPLFPFRFHPNLILNSVFNLQFKPLRTSLRNFKTQSGLDLRSWFHLLHFLAFPHCIGSSFSFVSTRWYYNFIMTSYSFKYGLCKPCLLFCRQSVWLPTVFLAHFGYSRKLEISKKKFHYNECGRGD